MKKTVSILLCLLVALSVLAGCGSNNTANDPGNQSNSSDNTNQVGQSTTAVTQKSDPKVKLASLNQSPMKTKVDQNEYLVYQDVFSIGKYSTDDTNRTAKVKAKLNEFNNKKVEKEGTFGILHDAFNKVVRYYVWGYSDNTQCIDWQWEVKFSDGAKIPTSGSYVKVKGTFEVTDSALDGLWIKNPSVTVISSYEDRGFDIDMLSMSGTLQWVEMQNITYVKDYFQDKTVCGFGAMQSTTSIKDLCYERWSIDFSTNDTVPAIGTVVEFTGKVNDGKIIDGKLYSSTQY